MKKEGMDSVAQQHYTEKGAKYDT